MASEPARPHRDPVMASLSAMMWRQAVWVAGEVADAGVDAFTAGPAQSALVCLRRGLGNGPGGLTMQSGRQVASDPGFALGGAGVLEAVGRTPDIFTHMNDTDQDVHCDAAPVGLGLDQIDLVVGAVDEHEPVPRVMPVAGLGLVEGSGDGVLSKVDHRATATSRPPSAPAGAVRCRRAPRAGR